MAQSIQEHAVALAVHLLTRQDGAEGGDQGGDTITVPLEGTAGHCAGSNDYDGRIGVRISAIFVILVTSLFGTWFPVFAKRHRGLGVPEWVFFIAKYFGSGVIIATAFIHLLAPATDALTDPCLEGPITGYDFAEGIALMTIFVMFFIEMIAMRASYAADNVQGRSEIAPGTAGAHPTVPLGNGGNEHAMEEGRKSIHVPGGDHLGHQREHTDNEDLDAQWQKLGYTPESYSAQLTAVFILEFGVIFHSIFIGLTLAVSGDEFNTLYVVLVFHQMFEGLGLGSRLAAVPWPQGKQWTPYLLGAGYAISTPIAIAIGLGVRTSYPPNSQTTLVVNGVFDSISAGILIYTGLVELMAHEFMFSPYMQRTTNKVWLSAFLVMCLGAGLMALLGKWA